jgi:hypothetical protein
MNCVFLSWEGFLVFFRCRATLSNQDSYPPQGHWLNLNKRRKEKKKRKNKQRERINKEKEMKFYLNETQAVKFSKEDLQFQYKF